MWAHISLLCVFLAHCAAASPCPLLCGSLVGWQRLLLLLLLLPVFLNFKWAFKSEGWQDFLLREGTSLIWASSPSTFLTRDPFKAIRAAPALAPLVLYPVCFRLPESLVPPSLRPLISPFLLCYWWWHAVYLCCDHIKTHTHSFSPAHFSSRLRMFDFGATFLLVLLLLLPRPQSLKHGSHVPPPGQIPKVEFSHTHGSSQRKARTDLCALNPLYFLFLWDLPLQGTFSLSLSFFHCSSFTSFCLPEPRRQSCQGTD